MKFVDAANNFIKLAEVRKNFANFVKFWSTFTKFVGLANNFYEVRTSWEQLCKVSRSEKNFTKFVKFTRSNIFLGKHKCFVNTFHKYIVVVTYE